MKTKWTVKPFYTPHEDSDPLGVFVVEEVKSEAEKWENASMDAAPNSEQEQHAIDRRGEITERAARLIAAAPELLSELNGLLEVFTAYIETEDVANGDIVEAVRDARVAIAKAEGKSHE
jgi:hypothetical protein